MSCCKIILTLEFNFKILFVFEELLIEIIWLLENMNQIRLFFVNFY